MVQTPICSFENVYKMFHGFTEVAIIRLNDGVLLYKGDLIDSIKTINNYTALVVPYSGIYNNRNTGMIDIEVWDLTILEAQDI